jgi:hypothetical protein
MAAPIGALFRNMGNITMMVGREYFLWDGVLHYTPKNVAEGPPEIQRWFIKTVEVSKNILYSSLSPERQREIVKKRLHEALKDCPPDPLMQTIVMVAHAASMVFIVFVGYGMSARL